MNCVYCENPLPDKWYESHCIPVARVEGEWVDMYNRLGELAAPIEHVAHWACHRQGQATKQGSQRERADAQSR